MSALGIMLFSFNYQPQFSRVYTDPPGPPCYYTALWDSRCDIDQNKKNEIIDLAKIAKLFGTVSPPWIPPPIP